MREIILKWLNNKDNREELQKVWIKDQIEYTNNTYATDFPFSNLNDYLNIIVPDHRMLYKLDIRQIFKPKGTFKQKETYYFRLYNPFYDITGETERIDFNKMINNLEGGENMTKQDLKLIDSTVDSVITMLNMLGKTDEFTTAEILEMLGVEHTLSMKIIDELTELNK